MTVCLNGGKYLQNEMRARVEYKFSSFSGNVTFSAGSVGTGSSGDGQGAGSPQAGEASAEGTGRGGVGGIRAEAGAPPAMSRMDKIRAYMNKKAVRPAGDVDAPELRKDAALREMAAYMKEAAPKNDSKFDFLQSVYWEARGTDGVGEGCSDCPLAAHRVACKVVCRHRYRTSCQAERNFSTLLKQVLSDMRAGTLAHKTDKIDAVARAQQAPYSRICEGRTGT